MITLERALAKAMNRFVNKTVDIYVDSFPKYLNTTLLWQNARN